MPRLVDFRVSVLAWTQMMVVWQRSRSFLLVFVAASLARPAWSDEWEEVQQILAGTRDIIVLDGNQKAAVRYEGFEEPEYGDWVVRHFLADPENFNPYTSNDAGVSAVQAYIFETLLTADREPPFELKGLVAKSYPEVSEDHLNYTFHIRSEVYFSDGTPLTVDDILFSMKVIQHPEVLAPHLRNYYSSVSDVRIEGPSKISFVCKEPYFRNDLMLGGFSIIPKHFYDPKGMLDGVSISSLIDGSWENADHAGSMSTFAQRFNRDFNRSILGSGPYLIENFERDVVTQQKVVLTRSTNYWDQDNEVVPASGYGPAPSIR